jgi:hypothetical protein
MFDRRCSREQVPKVSIGPPQERGANPGDRRYVLAYDTKKLAEETGRRPTREADPASRFAYTHQLTCGPFMVGREHDAKSGKHDVEAGIRVRQDLGIRHFERDVVEPFRFSSPSSADRGAPGRNRWM